MSHFEPAEWIGRSETRDDILTTAPIVSLGATLDRAAAPAAGDALPPLWHWLYFLPAYRSSEAGEDGHPRRGGFLPPIDLPRRMWAGSRLNFLRYPRIGEAIRRRSEIIDVRSKHGRSGELVFVNLRHEISDAAGPAIVEEQDIVYRDAPRPGDPAPAPVTAPAGADWADAVQPDALLLFRYSALTFNGHRIHYDHPYVTQVEGYPDLVVHGPLIATLLLEALQRHHPGAKLSHFEFRAQRPLFANAVFHVCGAADDAVPGRFRLWARDADGALCMDAQAQLAA